MPGISAGGSIFFIMVLDDFTKFKAVKPIRKKSEASVFVKLVIQKWEVSTGYKTESIRHDRAEEYMAQELKD
jgi:hypothetical protein